MAVPAAFPAVQILLSTAVVFPPLFPPVHRLQRPSALAVAAAWSVELAPLVPRGAAACFPLLPLLPPLTRQLPLLPSLLPLLPLLLLLPLAPFPPQLLLLRLAKK